MELIKYSEDSAGLKVDIDMYGGGPDLDEAKVRSEKLGVSMEFHGPIDHAALAETHKVRYTLMAIEIIILFSCKISSFLFADFYQPVNI